MSPVPDSAPAGVPAAPVRPLVRVVDDDGSFLRAVVRLLRLSGFDVQTFAAASELLSSPDLGVPGCVLTDLQMPGMDGLGLQAALAKAGHAIPVVFLSGHGDIGTAVQAMQQGAEDFLTKRSPRERLLAAVAQAVARDARERAERARVDALRAPFGALTPREREVLAHVLTGQMNKQVAADLGIDERSVKRHRMSVMAKLHVKSAVELTHLVEAAGLWRGGRLTLQPAPGE